MSKPYWIYETLTNHGNVISVRINNPTINEQNDYTYYLNDIITNLGNRILIKEGINIFHNGDLCCIIRLKDFNTINLNL